MSMFIEHMRTVAAEAWTIAAVARQAVKRGILWVTFSTPSRLAKAVSRDAMRQAKCVPMILFVSDVLTWLSPRPFHAQKVDEA